MSDMTVAEIVERLEDQLEAACHQYLPGGRRVGHEWDSRGSTNASGGAIAVVLTGAKRGAIFFAAGQGPRGREGGDILDVIEVVLNTTKRGAVEEAKRFLGLSDGPMSAVPRPAAKPRPKADAGQTARVETARGILGETNPLSSTLAESYLTGRGLAIPAPGWPNALRFHPALEWSMGRVYEEVAGPGGAPPRLIACGRRYPALVAAVTDLMGDVAAIWRIYLDHATGQKADVDPVKVGLGQKLGHACELFPIGPDGELHLGEGLESSLAVAEMIQWRYGVWSALDAGNLVHIARNLPPEVRRLTIWQDGDLRKRNVETGREIEPTGPRKAREALAVARARGIAAYCEPAPRGGDPLDFLRARRPGRVAA